MYLPAGGDGGADAGTDAGGSEDAENPLNSADYFEAKEPGPNFAPVSEPTDDRDERITELRDTVRDLRERLDREEEANRENRRLLAAALERIPAIEAPRDEPHAPETAPETSEGASPRSDRVGPQTSARRPWWIRIFGG